MTRTILTAVIMILLLPLTAAADHHRRGPGCWRTVPARRMALTRSVAPDKSTRYQGKRKGLVILAEFTDREFLFNHGRQKYNDILNAPGYTTSEGFQGSVADYFRDQSGGLFELTFDVIGPYTAKNNVSYYGRNNRNGYDLNIHELIAEMCNMADEEVDFADYDWDGDGEVEEVFIIYAGKGEADTGISNNIYPHMWTLEEAGLKQGLTLDGKHISVYACSNELNTYGRICGIGIICHEFSHCMGLPDFYDITYSGQFGMSGFDLMDNGNNSGSGFTPVNYTAYERMVCGWQQPIVLSDKDVSIDSLKPIGEKGETYIIYNDGHPDEFYMIENRQRTGWDKNYPAEGLMITHVDYDYNIWKGNYPNSILTEIEAEAFGGTVANDHQRMTLFHADNEDDYQYWNAFSNHYSRKTEASDLYPYRQNDSLTTTSAPAATLFNKNSLGTKLMQGAILNIKQNDDGTMSFYYRAGQQAGTSVGEAIRETEAPTLPRRIYTLDGRSVRNADAFGGRNADATSLGHGIYIVDGKKVVR